MPEITATVEITLTPELTGTPTLTATVELTLTPELTGTPEFTLTPTLTVTEEITLTETPTVTLEPTLEGTPTPTISVTVPLTEIVPLTGTLIITPGLPPVVGILADPPGSPSDEFVVIANGTLYQDMSGWTLTNEAGELYIFPTFGMAPDAYVRIWTGAGADGAVELYWGREGEDLWAAAGDTATLRDAEGNIISVCAYTVDDLSEGLRVCPAAVEPAGTIP